MIKVATAIAIGIAIAIVIAFTGAFWSALPFGPAIGVIYGPLRLAGVDFSAWFRDPGEVAERRDHSWIGLFKQNALGAGSLLLLCAPIYILFTTPYAAPFDVLQSLLGLTVERMIWRSGEGAAFLLGVAVGMAALQAVLGIIWLCGLRWGVGRARAFTLARRPRASMVAAVAPVAGRRRLVICCDGTWNSPDQKRETNVVHLLRAIKPMAADGVGQISYYHLGVGTGNILDRMFGGGAGIGLSDSVKACYGFLVDNYRPGDEILLFGFSRGAYVVRSVAGMINAIGLLQRREMVRFTDAWNYYAQPPDARTPAVLDQIAPERAKVVPVSCLGVWDTVGALGIPGSRICASAYSFHETALGRHVRHAFQALALDERRGNFQPAVWVRTSPDQTLEQVWFPGVHANIGGGYEEHGLSDTTLLWMVSRLLDHGLLDLDMQPIQDAVSRFHAEAPPTGRIQQSRTRFWRIVACPVPRAVSTTDGGEQIHESAYDRRAALAAGSRDVYAHPRRQQWLENVPNERICERSNIEHQYAYTGTDAGVRLPDISSPRRGLCDFLLRRLFGRT